MTPTTEAGRRLLAWDKRLAPEIEAIEAEAYRSEEVHLIQIAEAIAAERARIAEAVDGLPAVINGVPPNFRKAFAYENSVVRRDAVLAIVNPEPQG